MLLHVFLCAALQTSILIRSVKMMARANNIITFLKVLSIAFIVVVGVVGVVMRG